MAIPIFAPPPNSICDTAPLVAAALGLYANPVNLNQRHYDDNHNHRCLTDAANSILHYVEQLQAGRRLDPGAQIGVLNNGNPLLHATSTHHREGNCSIICEYVLANRTINVHAIGAHTGDYRYDGVSNVLHPLLLQNLAAGNGCRYVDNTYNAVCF